jgi:ankyrin repeat protein
MTEQKNVSSRSFLSDFDMNMSDYDGRTALHLTCAEGHLEAVQFLLEICKVHPEPKDRYMCLDLLIADPEKVLISLFT